jgi:hypothetical protein
MTRIPAENRTNATVVYETIAVVPSDTRCKHGDADCEACGTTSKRDALHTTRGGRGVVGRLGRKRR